MMTSSRRLHTARRRCGDVTRWRAGEKVAPVLLTVNMCLLMLSCVISAERSQVLMISDDGQRTPDHTTSGRAQLQEKESPVDSVTSQSRRHVRRSDGSDVMTPGVMPSSAVTFKSPASYVVTRVQLYATFSIYFKMKPRRGEGIILYSRMTHNTANWFAVELAGGDVRYTCVTSPRYQVRTLRVALSQSSWHDVTVRSHDEAGTHFLQVGNESVTLSLGDAAGPEVPRPMQLVASPGGRSRGELTKNRTQRSSFLSADDFVTTNTNDLYIGGLPRPFYARLPPEVTSRNGFSGCLAAINLNGDTRTLRSRGVRLPDQFYDDVIEGCEGTAQQCSATTCANGGICIQDWNSRMCDCDMTSYTGPTCEQDGVTYEFGSDVTGLEDSRYGAGMMTYIVDNADRVDSRQDQLAFGLTTLQTSDATLVYITSDNSNDYIRIELTDDRILAVYNMGLMDHAVSETAVVVNDGIYHVVRFTRSAQNATLQLDQFNARIKRPSGRQLTTFNRPSRVHVGARRDTMDNIVRPFHGKITGLVYNHQHILTLAAEHDNRVSFHGNVRQHTTPTTSSSTSSSRSTSVTTTTTSQQTTTTRSMTVTLRPRWNSWRSETVSTLFATDALVGKIPSSSTAAAGLARLEPSQGSHVTPASHCIDCSLTSSAPGHVTTRKHIASEPQPVEGAGRAWTVVGGVTASVAVLLLVVFAIYRYRRCYEGSYDVDAELPMNGYIPSGTCSETAILNKRNGSVKSMPHCTVSRSSKELYV